MIRNLAKERVLARFAVNLYTDGGCVQKLLAGNCYGRLGWSHLYGKIPKVSLVVPDLNETSGFRSMTSGGTMLSRMPYSRLVMLEIVFTST